MYPTNQPPRWDAPQSLHPSQAPATLPYYQPQPSHTAQGFYPHHYPPNGPFQNPPNGQFHHPHMQFYSPNRQLHHPHALPSFEMAPPPSLPQPLNQSMPMAYMQSAHHWISQGTGTAGSLVPPILDPRTSARPEGSTSTFPAAHPPPPPLDSLSPAEEQRKIKNSRKQKNKREAKRRAKALAAGGQNVGGSPVGQMNGTGDHVIDEAGSENGNVAPQAVVASGSLNEGTQIKGNAPTVEPLGILEDAGPLGVVESAMPLPLSSGSSPLPPISPPPTLPTIPSPAGATVACGNDGFDAGASQAIDLTDGDGGRVANISRGKRSKRPATSRSSPPASKRQRLNEAESSVSSESFPLTRSTSTENEKIAITTTTANGLREQVLDIKTGGLGNGARRNVLRQDIQVMRAWASKVDKRPKAHRYIKFYKTVDEMAKACKGNKAQKQPLLKVVRKAVPARSMEDAVKLTGRKMDHEMQWDDGTNPKSRRFRPKYSIQRALALGHRLKCLAVKNLPPETYTLAAKLGYDQALDLLDGIHELDPLTPEEQTTSDITVGKLLDTVNNPKNPLAEAYSKVKAATAQEMKEYFRIASCWGIINAEGSFTREHHDAAGSATHFLVHTGKKVWFIKTPGNKVEIVVLEAGDAVVMAPGVKHCVYTLEASVCIGGHGWAVEDIPRCYDALTPNPK